MPCSTCHSGIRRFTAEVCIHIPGIENLDKPGVMVFPSLSVCVDCGSAEFIIDQDELQKLRSHKSAARGDNYHGAAR